MRARRYNRGMRPVPLIVATLMLAATVSAQPTQGNRQAPPPEPDPLYHVEVILFEWVDGDRYEEDFFHGRDSRNEPPPTLLELPHIDLESIYDLDPLPTEDDLQSIPPIGGIEPLDTDRLELFEPWASNADAGAVGAPADDPAVPEGFRVLEQDELELTAERARLSRRPYRLLGHAGWVQTGVDSDRAVPLDLSRVGITNPKGTIQVYVRRFLHVAVDLDFYDASGAFWSGGATPFALTPFEYAKRYHLEDEHNAFRTGEYVVIDHPLFNVLVRVTPAPEPAEEADPSGARGPLG